MFERIYRKRILLNISIKKKNLKTFVTKTINELNIFKLNNNIKNALIYIVRQNLNNRNIYRLI